MKTNTAVRLAFMGHQIANDGYGYATIKVAEWIRSLSPGVDIVDMAHDGMFSNIERDRWLVDGAAVLLCIPDWLPCIKAQTMAIYTMFDSTRLPAGWAETINRHTARCLVPSRWCAETFADSGVHVPIEVVPLGMDANDYAFVDRGGRDGPYTFLWNGTPDYRKGWDVAYRAFVAAFGRREDVRLILHFRGDLPGRLRWGDPNVEQIVGMLTRTQWISLLARADCFVFPSRGEGWGLPPREAAATGLPVIATDYGGLADGLSKWGLPLWVRGMSPARYGPFDDIGEWAEPELDHLVELMRWCELHREEARAIGQRASAWLRKPVNGWGATALQVLDALQSISLRREEVAMPVSA